MATRPKFARLAHYSCECVEASHIFFKNDLWQMSASLASPSKTGWRVRAKQVGEYLPSLLMNVGTRKIGRSIYK